MKARINKARESKGRSDKKSAAGGGTRSYGMWLLLLALMLATLAAYQPVWHGGMLWDDDSHITSSGMRSVQGLWRIWFDLGATQQYYPAVHSAFWIMHKLWGDDTLAYHLLNIFLHALSAFLVALILRRLSVPGAWLAAVIFALHPVQVESVAWIAELKNTLSGVFYLGSALAYLRFDEFRQKRFYALALVLFVLALLSKTVTATLPAALLVVFWWQRGRLKMRGDVLPLMPFFACGAAGGLLTVWVERTLIGAQGAEFQFTLIERSLIAGRAICFYLGKLLWPSNLIFIYPRWQVSQEVWWQYIYLLVVAALLAGLWGWRKRSRAPLAAMLLFCGTLFPALGFFNIYPFRFSFVADHFQYLASISMIAFFSAGVANALKRWDLKPKLYWAVLLVFGCALAFPTWSQSRQYASAETLYRTTISRNPMCWMAYVNLGNLEIDNAVDEAIAHFNEALRLKPNFAEAHVNLSNALLRMGRLEEAVAECEAAIRINHDYPEAYYNLGVTLLAMGHLQEAIARFKDALRINPEFAVAHSGIGDALQKMGRFEEAAVEYHAAQSIKPGLASAFNSQGELAEKVGHFDEAMTEYQESLRLKPDNAEVWLKLANVLQRMGRFEEAVLRYNEALRLRPNYAEVHSNLGDALQRLGRLEEAVKHYKEALRIKPDFAYVHNNLGYALQALGHLDEAVAQYREALRLMPDNADARANLIRALTLKR